MSVIGWLFIILGTAFCVSVPLFLAVMAQEHREEQSSADVAREVLVPGMGGEG